MHSFSDKEGIREISLRGCSIYKITRSPLQAFAFSVVTVNDEHTKPRFKRKLLGVKFNDGIIMNRIVFKSLV